MDGILLTLLLDRTSSSTFSILDSETYDYTMVAYAKIMTIAALAAPVFAQSGCGVDILDATRTTRVVIGSGCVPPGGRATIWSEARQANFFVVASSSCGLGFAPGTGAGATLQSAGRANC
ncbi:hypothetical protein ACJZ2D_016273 [Fusarium nematophilum]